MTTQFKLKNHDTRSYLFANRMCISGSGNVTPPEAAKLMPDGKIFRLPPAFEMSEEEMFKSYRGVIAAMETVTRSGKPAIEVYVNDLVEPLTKDDLKGWAAEHRSGKGWPEPRTVEEHARETERAMNRPKDPIELHQEHLRNDERAQRRQETADLIRELVPALLEAMTRPPVPSTPPAAVGRNDEKPEPPAAPVQSGRARPRE